MSEHDGYRYGEEPGGERPSGRGAVAEQHARQDEELREGDLTDDAAGREEEAAQPVPAHRTAGDKASAPGPEAGEEEPPTGWETPGAVELHPGPAPAAAGPASTAGSTSIFDVGQDGAAPGPMEPGTPHPAAPATAAATAGPPAVLLASLDAEGIRGRFLDIQASFVDEPHQAVEEADRFVQELVQQVLDALQARRGQLKAPVAQGSTEDLRLALRGYRQVVDRLLGLAM